MFIMKINMKRHIKMALEILWLKIKIANRPPKAPPIVETVKSSFSGILLLFFMAKNLSKPKRKKLTTLMDKR